MSGFRILIAWLAMVALTLTGCGGVDDDSSGGEGEVIIGLTDAEADFMAYAVDVNSIKLTHVSGAEVEVLPQSSRIDFSQYVDMTEFVTAATIPNGKYKKVTLTLDYSNADVQVEVAGEAAQATVQDSDGNPITVMDVSVTLDTNRPLVIAPGIPAHLTLDFDLETSNSVDTGVTPPMVTVLPMLLADVELNDPKPHRLRGLLEEVDEAAQTIKLAMRPLQHRHGDFGHFKAHVDDDTHYEVDGVAYTGSEGLAQVALQPLASWVVVYGSLNTNTRRFEASEVYAGSSVPGSDQDALTGIVTARSDNELIVTARMIVRTDGSLVFNADVAVMLDSETVVTKQLSQDNFSIDDISVGQRIHVLGSVTDSSGDLSIASAERVRMMLTPFSGSVVSTNDGELVVDLQQMAGQPATGFNFAGTGQSTAQDADEANYQVNTATLSLAGIDINDPVRVRGFVTPFGSAPADFDANSVTDVAAVQSDLAITWETPATAPFVSSSDSELVVDLTDSGRHYVRRHWVLTDLTSLAVTTPSIVPAGAGRGLFAIHQNGAVYVYTQFSAFETALSEKLDGSVGVTRIMAGGDFDNDTATLTTSRVRIMLR
ncbi:MAG TPA: DUF4382 domain-containing protein [Candidatus Tenderia electrophaga]|uniref:DUF4382 domain-containing protein n=1 Tax=Candidatus Tenderia electrophaga TaxID=1748243 RepID=A0A832JA95_9GAMM|nr:DUF4382 domain-containing protein [Candidatus Tenderia electrophaga]